MPKKEKKRKEIILVETWEDCTYLRDNTEVKELPDELLRGLSQMNDDFLGNWCSLTSFLCLFVPYPTLLQSLSFLIFWSRSQVQLLLMFSFVLFSIHRVIGLKVGLFLYFFGLSLVEKWWFAPAYLRRRQEKLTQTCSNRHKSCILY